MPRRATNMLCWSPAEQRYIITAGALAQATDILSSSHVWREWLDAIPSFAFQSRFGGHCTVRKERLQRGDAYWYGYRSIRGQTKKHYIGRTADLSLERLESISARFVAEERETAGSVPARDQAQPGPDHRIALAPTPLLATKLYRPRLAAQLVERARLLDLLDAGRAHRLTLLHAPAGFGKTTLVNQWLSQRQKVEGKRQTGAGDDLFPSEVAWLSLDSGDNDPVRFWSYIIAAYQTFHAQLGQAALQQLALTPQLPFPQPPLETALTLLINDLSGAAQGRLLILDDYHLITQARIHETLAFFIEHLPAHLHIMILTRSTPPLPLPRWRARGDLLEVQTAQLRFSQEEMASFLGQLPYTISEAAVQALTAYLEGWAAGLRLLTLHARLNERADYLAQLQAGSATQPHRSIQDYFTSEVLHAQPEPLQSFLLQTSMLSRLSGDLCDAVTGGQGSAIWLEQVERAGFFLELLDSAGQWYRYHALFAEAMRSEASRRLGAEALCRLSLRASRWYEAHGMPVEAIEAALYAQATERAAQLIERFSDTVTFSEHHTMLRWLAQLPEPLLQGYPALGFRYAQAQLFANNGDVLPSTIGQIERWLQLAEDGWRSQGDRPRLGELYAFRVILALQQGLTEASVAHARQALQFLPTVAEQPDGQADRRPGEWADWRSACLVALGAGAMSEGAFDVARPLLTEAYTRSRNSSNRTFTRIIMTMLGEACIGLGELHQAAEYYQQTLADAGMPLDDMGDAIIRAVATAGLARLAYEWNQLERAEQLTHTAFEHRYYYWAETLRAENELLALLLLAARGSTSAAQQQLNALFVRLQPIAAPTTREIIPNLLAWQVRFQIRDGDLAAVERTLQTLASYQGEMYPLQIKVQQILWARLLLAQGQAEAALDMLERLHSEAQARKHITQVFEIQLLIALAYAARKQEQAARQQLYTVLAQTRGAGFIRLFLNEGEPLVALLHELLPSIAEPALRSYARAILQASSAALGSGGTDGLPVEPLSHQERRVLALLATGRSNPKIAQELIVSVNTVKGHIKNIYRKLDVNNRIQASAVARRLELI